MSLSVGEKRLLKDVININKNPLDNHGIYYIHDDTNIKRGYALILGPSDTIYSHGIYFFNFYFPNDYPYSPPRVEYLTNGDNIRFNPNLYRNGKVCVSILNTWNGPQWSSCQTISSILLTIVTLFHNKPLLNEPGITENYTRFNIYNDIIKYASIKVALLDVLSGKICKTMYDKFKTIIDEYIVKNKKIIVQKINDIDNMLNDENGPDKVLRINLYNIVVKCQPKGTLLNRFNNLKQLE